MMMTTFKKVHLWLLDSNSLTLITFSLILHPMISLQSQKKQLIYSEKFRMKATKLLLSKSGVKTE